MDVPGLVAALQEGGGPGGAALPGAVGAVHCTPPAEPSLCPYPDWVHPDLQRVLADRGIASLYSHQALVAEALHRRKATVVATATASGKSLSYNLPVLDALLRRGAAARALYLFPTKALARDQMAELEGLLAAVGFDDGAVAVYDGDTPPAVRSALRERGQLVLTNPHMLHVGILPNHTKWQGLFSSLEYVVVDEVHTLSGVYGSHVANVLRRLRRICRHYGSEPTFCGASATISNPGEHARALFETDVEVVDEDGSGRGPRTFLFFNPDLVSPSSGLRVPALDAARDLAGLLLPADLQSIWFTRSRRSLEVLLKYLRDEAKARHVDQERIAGYRGGYLPELRRSIEKGLRAGKITAVAATSALELGVDIGSLDVCVLVGYPGTVSSTFQRAGRVGRKGQPSAVVFLARSNAMDQYLMQDPGYLFDKPREAVTVDPNNPILLANHVKCSAFELPFDDGEDFGGAEDTAEVLEFLTRDLGVLVHQGGRYHYADQTYPADGVSLNAADMDNVVIQDLESGKTLAEIDRAAAITEVYTGAIYGHQGDQYLVEEFAYDDRRAFVKKVEVDYYTDAETETEVRILHLDDTTSFPTYRAHLGEVHVSTLAKAFKKIRFYTRENVGIGEIHLPPEEYETEACVLCLSQDLVDHLGLDKGAGASCLSGLGELVRGLVPLFARVDPADVRVNTEVRHPHFERPTLTLYDKVPNGVGLSERIYTVHRDILKAARGLVERCRCRTGCPSCVGAAAAPGRRGKEIAAAILDGML